MFEVSSSLVYATREAHESSEQFLLLESSAEDRSRSSAVFFEVPYHNTSVTHRVLFIIQKVVYLFFS